MALVEIIPEESVWTECDNKFPWAVCDWRSGSIYGPRNAAFYLGTCCKYSYLFGAANQYVPSRVQETRQLFTSANGLMFIDLNVSSRSMSQPVIGNVWLWAPQQQASLPAVHKIGVEDLLWAGQIERRRCQVWRHLRVIIMRIANLFGLALQQSLSGTEIPGRGSSACGCGWRGTKSTHY